METRPFLSYLFLCTLVAVTAVRSVQGEDNLYDVLGVSNSASSREIRSAYKRLAKQWHPDKNKLPEAQEKFIEINRAYEVLSDEDKRHTYDMTGDVGDSPNPRTQSHGNGYTVFTTGNGFHFRFFTGGPTHRGDSISTDTFFNNILSNSHHKPYLINFYTDFCMQCGHVEQLWNDMRKEMLALGVGLGSVHANHHPRVTHHCGVSQVPTVVGVVSGRVIHFHGNIRGSGTMQEFLERILPKEVVLPLSDLESAESFLSKVITRNRPRAILFSPHRHPSLRYKLAALAHHGVADCAFVSTHRSWLDEQLLARFKVQAGDKEMMIFTDESTSEPSQYFEGFQLKGDMLKSLLGQLRLRLPRLSSQEMFNRVCSADGGSRLCVVMLVIGTSEYNDTVTRSFRELSASSHSQDVISFSYLDVVKQEEFYQAIGEAAGQLKDCENGGKARHIVMLKRISSQQIKFDWYNQFCGEAGDSEAIQSHLSRRHHLNRLSFVPRLLDEEAPGWLGRQWNRVVKFYYDLMDFISAIDPQMLMSIGVLAVGSMAVCCLGLISAGQQEQESSNRSHFRNPSHQRNSQGHSVASSGSPQRRKIPVHYLGGNNYRDLVQNAPKGQLCFVLFIDTHDSDRSRPLAQSFWRVMESYVTAQVKVCFACYRTYPRFLGNVLTECEDISKEEREVRVKMTLTGKCATVLAVIGSKRQFSIFPDKLDRNGAVVGERERRSVGEALGDTLGFDDSEGSDDEQCQNRSRDKNASNYSTESNGITRRAAASASIGGTESRSVGNVKDVRLEQMKQLEVWTERFFDGSLKRLRVQQWPEWQ